MSIITDETARAGDGLAAPGIVTGLIDLATSPVAGLVTPSLNIPVPDGPRCHADVAIDVIAERLGVPVTEHLGPDGNPDGTLFAERWFGSVRVEAHLCDPDRRVGGHRSLAAWQDATARDEAAA
jgi:hypothetical protein